MSKTVVAEKFRRPANSVVKTNKNLDSAKLDEIYNMLRILSDQLLVITDKLAFIADNMPKKLNTNFLK